MARRKKNLSTGAWIAIAVAIGVIVPGAVILTIFVWGAKKAKEIVEDFPDMPPVEDRPPVVDPDPVPDRPIPPIPPIG